MEHFAYVSKVLDANAFAFLVFVIDVHWILPPFTEYLSTTHEVISADNFAMIEKPINCFRCAHGLAQIEFVIEYHDVGAPEFWFMHW